MPIRKRKVSGPRINLPFFSFYLAGHTKVQRIINPAKFKKKIGRLRGRFIFNFFVDRPVLRTPRSGTELWACPKKWKWNKFLLIFSSYWPGLTKGHHEVAQRLWARPEKEKIGTYFFFLSFYCHSQLGPCICLFNWGPVWVYRKRKRKKNAEREWSLTSLRLTLSSEDESKEMTLRPMIISFWSRLWV